MPYIKYTDAQKAAYYARKAQTFAKQANYKKYQRYASKSKYFRGSGQYYAPTRFGRSYTRGRGGYKIPKNFFNAQQVGGTLGGAVGGLLGSMVAPGIGTQIGTTLGERVGKGAGQMFKKVTGWGDYSVKENSLLYPDRIVPSFGPDTIRVKKREFIANINATTAFNNNIFAVNPGDFTTFPWLSNIAHNYDQYRFNGLIFQFVSTASDAIASTTNLGLGQVCLATDYNAADAGFVNMPQMLGTMFSNSGKPSQDILHAIECASPDTPQKLYYVRSGEPPEGTDIRLYDMCTFQIATENMQADYVGMGQLWVTYDVTFCKSVQNNQLGLDLNTDQWSITSADGSNPFGASTSNRTLRNHSNLGTTLDNQNIYFPEFLESGYYLIVYSARGASTSLTAPLVATGTNCTLISSFANNTANTITNIGTTATQGIITLIVRIDARDASITITAGALPGTPTFADLIITQVNGELYI